MPITQHATAAPAHLLRIADLDRPQLMGLLALAAELKREPYELRHAHAGATVACYFAKPSTRTRVSFEAAAYRLGMLPLMLRPDELQLGRGEPIADTARVLSSYCAAIVIRTFAQGDVEAVARAASVPVVNALTDDHHPCQALADLLTIRERFDRLEGVRLAYVGDSTNVAHSLMEAGALMGLDVRVASPPGYAPEPAIEGRARELAAAHGGAISVVYEPEVAVRDADVVYTDVWVSMGDEAEQERRVQDLAPFRVTPQLMALADPAAAFMHCLPAHRGMEVDAEVIDGPQSLVFAQAANRLPTEQALLHMLVSGRLDAPA